MAIALDCINVIIPFDVIRHKYPGRAGACLLDHRGSIGAMGLSDSTSICFGMGAMDS